MHLQDFRLEFSAVQLPKIFLLNLNSHKFDLMNSSTLRCMEYMEFFLQSVLRDPINTKDIQRNDLPVPARSTHARGEQAELTLKGPEIESRGETVAGAQGAAY